MEASRTNRPFEYNQGLGVDWYCTFMGRQWGDCSAGNVDSRVTLDISKYHRSTRLESFTRILFPPDLRYLESDVLCVCNLIFTLT